MKVLAVEPNKAPYEKEIDSGLRSLQKEVGGSIEAVYPFEDEVAIICNEDGKFNGMPLNRALKDEDGDIYDIIAGPFLITGLTENNFGSLTDEQIKTYGKMYEKPEMFMRMGNSIVAIPLEPDSPELKQRQAAEENRQNDSIKTSRVFGDAPQKESAKSHNGEER